MQPEEGHRGDADQGAAVALEAEVDAFAFRAQQHRRRGRHPGAQQPEHTGLPAGREQGDGDEDPGDQLFLEIDLTDPTQRLNRQESRLTLVPRHTHSRAWYSVHTPVLSDRMGLSTPNSYTHIYLNCMTYG